MAIGIVGRKVGMTRVFTESGASVPVTVIEVEPNRVTQLRTPEKDGYSAIQVTTGSCKASRVNKPVAGHLAKANVEAGRGFWEFRTSGVEAEGIEVGSEIKVDIFSAGQIVDVRGRTHGKGFQGGVKRHGFKMQDASHGNSVSHRAPGSIGQCQTPGRVFKGKKMAGQMGNATRSSQNLEVMRVDAERNLILVRGSVAGSRGGDVIVTPAIKKLNKGNNMDLNIKTGSAASSETLQVVDTVFGAALNEALVHQVVTAYLATARSGTKAQKNRSAVSGGGSKPFRQKGMGRARAGTSRSPIWRTGGVTFAAAPSNYNQKVNRKMYRGALRSILSELVRQERLIVVSDVGVDAPKTKALTSRLKEFGLAEALIVSDQPDENLYLSARNLKNVDVCDVLEVNPISLIGFKHVLITASAVRKLEERLS